MQTGRKEVNDSVDVSYTSEAVWNAAVRPLFSAREIEGLHTLHTIKALFSPVKCSDVVYKYEPQILTLVFLPFRLSRFLGYCFQSTDQVQAAVAPHKLEAPEALF